MELPAPISYSPYGADSIITFENVESLQDFVETEREAWIQLFKSSIRNDQGLEAIRDKCDRALDQAVRDIGVLSTVSSIEKFQQSPFNQVLGRLENFLANLARGVPFPGSETALGIKVLAIANIDASLAFAHLAMVSPGYAGVVGNTNQAFQLQSLLRATAYLDRAEVTVKADDATRNLHKLHAKFQKRLKDWEKFTSDQAEKAEETDDNFKKSAKAQSDAFTQSETARGEEFGKFFEDVKEQWKNLKITYDTQMALRAPTTYWETEASLSRTNYWYAVFAFSSVAAVSLAIFLYFGIPYLADGANKIGQNVLIHVLPILIPSFIVIWILKIISKLMSGYLQRSDDSNERRVMVMTFLALMNNKDGLSPLVSDQDRILILHALFRPAAVSPSDEAPPVHWFDILTSRTKS